MTALFCVGFLLADVGWGSLAVQVRKKRFFVQPAAGSQQFQKRILCVIFCAGRLAQVDRVSDERTRRCFQLRSCTGLAGQELDELAHAFTLFFCPGREFDAHAMSGVHDPD